MVFLYSVIATILIPDTRPFNYTFYLYTVQALVVGYAQQCVFISPPKATCRARAPLFNTLASPIQP